MTLKEELEILRGEPIEVFSGNPLEIPCIETSDAERLCKNPVVSVCMVTYNHEAYIRQAIEGVMMQKTDFEFELVIGEDCSTDKTREICFEYQKKYPDKIRVLWWHENLYKLNHPAGLNFERTSSHCRGEFMAICEGDDYWIDPLKLQKQVDVMRKHPNVGWCFCGSKRYFQKDDRYDVWNEGNVTYKTGVQNGCEFFVPFMLGTPPGLPYKPWLGFIMTATTMIKRGLYEEIKSKYEVFSWRLRLGDATMWLGASSLMDGYYISDIVSVYRISDSGMFQNPMTRAGVHIDGIIVRLYYFRVVLGLDLTEYPVGSIWSLVVTRMRTFPCVKARVKYALSQFKGDMCHLTLHWYMLPFWFSSALYNRLTFAVTRRIAGPMIRYKGWSKSVLALYK